MKTLDDMQVFQDSEQKRPRKEDARNIAHFALSRTTSKFRDEHRNASEGWNDAYL